jgi:hypothetical protein
MLIVLLGWTPLLKRRRGSGESLLAAYISRDIPADKYSGDDEEGRRDLAAKRA